MLSVIVPTYNNARYIKKAIESVFCNTKYNIEMIIINDKSEDETEEILKDYNRENTKINIINLEKNMGVSYCRNLGIKNAKGKYIAFLDADDYIEYGMYDKAIEMIEKESADICICNYYEIFGDIKINSKYKYNNLQNDKDKVIKLMLDDKISMAVWDKIILKEKLEKMKFNTNIKVGEDIIFSIELLKNIDKIILLDECLYNYVQNEVSVMHKPSSDMIKLASIDKYINKETKEYLDNNYHDEFEIFKNVFLVKAIHAISQCDSRYMGEKYKFLKQICDKNKLKDVIRTNEISFSVRVEICILKLFGVRFHLLMYPMYAKIKRLTRGKNNERRNK